MPRQHQEQLKNRLRQLRAQRRWTQKNLADKVDVSRQTIIAIEKGEYSPSAVLALKIAAALNMTMEQVFWLQAADEPAQEPVMLQERIAPT